jgi:hypothetical protein
MWDVSIHESNGLIAWASMIRPELSVEPVLMLSGSHASHRTIHHVSTNSRGYKFDPKEANIYTASYWSRTRVKSLAFIAKEGKPRIILVYRLPTPDDSWSIGYFILVILMEIR